MKKEPVLLNQIYVHCTHATKLKIKTISMRIDGYFDTICVFSKLHEEEPEHGWLRVGQAVVMSLYAVDRGIWILEK